MQMTSRMLNTVRRNFKEWADNSTGLGIACRRIQREIRTQAYRRYRKGNVAMLHAGRCGSSVLADLLNQRPDFRWRGEPFEDMIPAYYHMAAKNRADHVIGNCMYEENISYFGFDSKYLPEQHLRPELANKTPVEYISLLEKLGFTHYILLDRKNHLRRAISTAIGANTGIWNSFEPIKNKSTVHLDPERFMSYGKEMSLLSFFDSLDDTYSILKNRLRGCKLLELNYETDIQNDPQISYRKTCGFLEIEPVNVNVRLNKMNPHPVRELVENYGEVAATLTGTKYEWMLHD